MATYTTLGRRKFNSGFVDDRNKFQIIDNKVVEYRRIMVHQFTVKEEDTELFASTELWKWQQSEQGAWVMEHAVEQPEWYVIDNPTWFVTKVAVIAKLSGKDITFWELKWGGTDRQL